MFTPTKTNWTIKLVYLPCVTLSSYLWWRDILTVEYIFLSGIQVGPVKKEKYQVKYKKSEGLMI